MGRASSPRSRPRSSATTSSSCARSRRRRCSQHRRGANGQHSRLIEGEGAGQAPSPSRPACQALSMIPLLERMRAALDAHDLDTFVGFFREDYVGERPRHPGAPVSSRDDVRTNWAEVIGDVPDLRVEIPAAVEDGDTIWSEWRAYGTARSGAMLELRGVIIF